MSLTIGVRFKVTGAEGIKKAQINKFTRAALVEVGNRWHGRYLKRHFTKRGAQIYGYGARSGESGSGKKHKHSYQAWKEKRSVGHGAPLVKSGKGKQEALANRIVKARISSKLKLAVVTISLPRIFNFNLRKSGKSNTAANVEITSVTRSEVRDLEKTFSTSLIKQYEKAGRRVSVASTSFRG